MDRRFIPIVLSLAFCVGCTERSEPAVPNTDTSRNSPDGKPQSNDVPSDEYTHVIAIESEYYTTGPQQGRPPDGTFKTGTKVAVIEDAGSYSRVRSADGIEAYVAHAALKETEGASSQGADLRTVVTGNNRFAFELYGKLRTEQTGNLFLSPASISTAVAMTYAGARGATEQEMASVLHFVLPQERLHPAFASLTGRLTNQGKKGYELRIANRLWGQQDYGFLPPFLDVTRTHYGAELAQVDFAKQTEQARQQINIWVAEQTQNKIKDLMPEGSLNDLTRLVLTNAISFKGKWTNQFDKKATKDQPFHTTADKSVDVPMMRQEEKFKYAETDQLQVLELPYAGGDLSMLVLLPKDLGGLQQLEVELTTDNLEKWSNGLRQRKVTVELPRFKLTSQFQLADVLTSMGMASAFDPAKADFSGMSSEEDLHLSAVIHKAFVDVNEEGTEAAAATGVAVGATSIEITPTFRADHPFVFLIQDNRTGSVLFIGRVTNPKEQTQN